MWKKETSFIRCLANIAKILYLSVLDVDSTLTKKKKKLKRAYNLETNIFEINKYILDHTNFLSDRCVKLTQLYTKQACF